MILTEAISTQVVASEKLALKVGLWLFVAEPVSGKMSVISGGTESTMNVAAAWAAFATLSATVTATVTSPWESASEGV